MSITDIVHAGNSIAKGEPNQALADLFPHARGIKLPDMRSKRILVMNIKTAICGLKKYCELGNADCPVYCVKTGADMKELNGREL